MQKQPSGGVLSKMCSENMQQNDSRALMLCKVIEITLGHGCSSVNFLHIFRTTFLKNTSRGLPLTMTSQWKIASFFS